MKTAPKNTPAETPAETPAPAPDFSALFDAPETPAPAPAGSRRETLQREATTRHDRTALSANYLADLPQWIAARINAPDLQRATRTEDRAALVRACQLRIDTAQPWKKCLDAAGSSWFYLIEARKHSPTFAEIYERIEETIKAARVDGIESAISDAAAGRPCTKEHAAPDIPAAKLYLGANDPKYKPGQGEAAPVVNIQLNL